MPILSALRGGRIFAVQENCTAQRARKTKKLNFAFFKILHNCISSQASSQVVDESTEPVSLHSSSIVHWPEQMSHDEQCVHLYVYYESIKREPKIRGIYENGRIRYVCTRRLTFFVFSLKCGGLTISGNLRVRY